MEERPRNDISDGYSWWCKVCKLVSQSERGAFFQNQGHPSEVADVAVSMG